MLQNTIELKKHQTNQKSKKSFSGFARCRSASLSTAPTGTGTGAGDDGDDDDAEEMEMDTDELCATAETAAVEGDDKVEYGMEVVEGAGGVGVGGQEKPYLVAGTTDYITSG